MALQNDLHYRLKNVTKSNGVEVLIQDQTSDIIDYYICRVLFPLEIAVDVAIDDRTITVVDASAVTAGTYVCIQQNARAFQAMVASKLGNVLTLDTPIDYPFTTEASIQNRDPQLNVDGSITPISATLKPMPGVKWDITRIILSMTHVGNPDDGKFGDQASLTNGIVLRKSDGIHHTIFNAKNNGDLRERMYDVTFSDRAPGGQYGTSGRRSFAGQDKNGVVIRLDGDKDDALEVLIQDDLTGLTSFKIVAQGHVVED